MEKLNRNHIYKNESDAEVILYAYEDNGIKCVNDFNGMFAFCLWDSDNEKFFAVRDRFGLKPLFYSISSSRVIFASEIKGFFADPSVIKQPNDRIIYEYLVGGARGSRSYAYRTCETFFSNIMELPPAHYMVYENNNDYKLYRYWCPKKNGVNQFNKWSEQTVSDKFLQLFRDSIILRLPDETIGTFLSGGLDSTSLACQVEDIIQNEDIGVNTEQALFSAVYKEIGDFNEIEYVKIVENFLGKSINYLFLNVKNKWEDIKKFIYHIEEPVGVFNYYVYWYIFQMAKEKVKIFFHGQGPDEAIGGHTRHFIIYLNELFRNKKYFKLLKEFFLSTNWVLPYMLRSMWFKRNAKPRLKKLLKPTFLSKFEEEDKKTTDDNSLLDALITDTTQLLVEHLRVEDRASSAFNLECRHPYLDHRIIEYIYSLKSSFVLKNGYSKYPIRSSMKGHIPEIIRKRKKKGATSIPFYQWIKELRPEILYLLKSPIVGKNNYVNKEAFIDLIKRCCDGNFHGVERFYYPGIIWRILNLLLWLEVYEL